MTSRWRLAHVMLVNFSETAAGISGRCWKRRVKGFSNQMSVTWVPPPCQAGSENETAMNLPSVATAA